MEFAKTAAKASESLLQLRLERIEKMTISHVKGDDLWKHTKVAIDCANAVEKAENENPKFISLSAPQLKQEDSE